MDTVHQSSGWRGKLAGGALALSIFAAAWFVIAALGSKFGLWSWMFGLGKMTIGWGPKIAGAAIVISAIALIASLLKAPRKKPFILSLAALLIAGLTLGRLAAFGALAAGLPPIHDAQTDWDNPVQFSDTLMAARKSTGAMNPVEDAPVIKGAGDRWPGYDGKLVSQAQEDEEQDPAKGGDDDSEKKYRPMQTLVSPIAANQMYDRALALANSRGWEIVTADAARGQIEATETSGWYGFKDDVAIRIGANNDGETIVDMRSISRVGLSDLGANAKRVANFMDDLERGVE